jgi:hypothetical protein
MNELVKTSSRVNWIRAVMCVVVAATLSSLMIGCASNGSQRVAPPRPARINHIAFFKLHHPEHAAELIADCDTHLANIPGVVSYVGGTHLDTGRGAAVDGDYDVGFYVGFMTEEALANYVKHPQHVAMVEKWRPRWQWIRVIDVVDETP